VSEGLSRVAAEAAVKMAPKSRDESLEESSGGESPEVDFSDGDSSSDDDETAEGAFYGARVRYRLQEMANDHDLMQKGDEEDEEEHKKALREQLEYERGEKMKRLAELVGEELLEDLVPTKKLALRCKYCPKRLVSDNDVVDHLKSKKHKLTKQRSEYAGLSKEEVKQLEKEKREEEGKSEEVNAKKSKKKRKRKTERTPLDTAESRKKRKAEDLSEDAITKLKAKFQKKKERRAARKAMKDGTEKCVKA